MKKLLIISTIHFLLFTGFALAQPSGGSMGGQQPPKVNNLNFSFPNPFKTSGTLYELARDIVNKLVLPIGGVLCVLAFIYAGFRYVIAQGNPGKIKEANFTLLYAAIGTAVLLGSWVIANVVENTIKALTS